MNERIDNNTIIYLTGYTDKGLPLIGGVWTLKDQSGYPIEMSYVSAITNGYNIDWAEAMADASLSNRCPALMRDIETFLSTETISHLKNGFIHNIKSGKSFQCILDDKRANGKKCLEFVNLIATKLSEHERNKNNESN